MATVQEILDSISGKQNNSNLPKCSTTVTTGLHIESTNDDKILAECAAIKPSIKLERHNQYVVCDLIYASAFDQDLHEAYSVFELYGSNMNDIDMDNYVEGDRRIPFLVIVLTALAGYDNTITLDTPIMWSLVADRPGATPNVIRVLFTVESVLFYDGEKIDEGVGAIDKANTAQFNSDVEESFLEQKAEEQERTANHSSINVDV